MDDDYRPRKVGSIKVYVRKTYVVTLEIPNHDKWGKSTNKNLATQELLHELRRFNYVVEGLLRRNELLKDSIKKHFLTDYIRRTGSTSIAIQSYA